MKLIRKYSAGLTALFIFIIYLITLAPSVMQIDSGELAAVQAVAGIAHPTGYPLFTMLGWLFLKIPVPFTKIFQANILAALWCALSVLFLIKTYSVFLSSERESAVKDKKKKSKKISEADAPSISGSFPQQVLLSAPVLAAVSFAFSITAWLQSTSVEVYSLHLFLMSLIIFSLAKAYYSPGSSIKPWLIFSVFLAFGFTNHMTTILILPGSAYLFFKKEKFGVPSLKKIGIMLVVFFTVLITVYLYLPLRAAQNPPVNWGNPIDFERFMRHFTGKQYQVWLFSSFEAAKKQLAYYVQNLPSEFGYIGLLLPLTGIIYLFKQLKSLFIFTLVTFLFSVGYSINYDINDIDSYFLLSYMAISIFAFFGILWITSFTSKKFKSSAAGLIAAVVILSGQFLVNFSKADQSGTYVYEDYTKELLNSVEKNSVIFSYQWDYFLSASYYYQYVEGIRTDIAVIDKELLRRSWYYNQIERIHPEIIAEQKKNIKGFLDALKPFERDEAFDANLLENFYRSIMTGLVADNIGKRDFYLGPEIIDNEMRQGQFALPEGYTAVPHLFLFKVVKGNDYVPAPDPEINIRIPKTGNKYSDFIKQIVSSMMVNRSLYELKFGKVERAKLYAAKAKEVFPEIMMPGQVRDLLQ